MLEGPLQESGFRDAAEAEASLAVEAALASRIRCGWQVGGEIKLGIPRRRFVARPGENQQQTISPNVGKTCEQLCAHPLIRSVPLICFGGTAGLCGFERNGQRRVG